MSELRPIRTSLHLLLAIASGLLLAQVPAQESPPAAPASEGGAAAPIDDEIIVRGRRLEDIENDLRIHVHDFIGEVVATPPGRGFARWHGRVCVGVYNLESRAAQYIADRISRLALDVGLTPGEPGCQPGVNIVFSTNARETASAMVENEPRTFMPVGGYAGADLGRIALADFADSEKAVRWWHVSLPVDARTGGPAIETSKLCGEAFCPPYVNVAGPSRLHNGTRDDLMYVIIVVDATQLKQKTWQQIGDYLAVISLAQIDPSANPAAFDSILNLFTNPAAYSGLTDWDRSYIRALYAIDQERLTSLQTNQIVSRIVEEELQHR